MPAIKDDYVCTLNAATLEKAKKELHEDPKERLNAVEAFRQWILSQPHLKCDTDTRFMLIFLRSAKFSQLRAREMLEGFLKIIDAMPFAFKNIDTYDESLNVLLDSGVMLPLPKVDNDGRSIMMMRPGLIEMSSPVHTFANRMRLSSVMHHYVGRKDENILVNGNVFIMDFSNVSMTQLTSMMKQEEQMQKFGKTWMKNMPGRFKAFHYYNAGTIIEFIMVFIKMFLPQKYIERIHIHDTLESLYKKVPMECLPLEYLPDEYKGASAGSAATILANFKKAVRDPVFHDQILEDTSKDMGIDESKRPVGDIPQESFRKLSVD